MNDLNSENRIAIRRYHNQLKVTSNGVMILGLWSTIKAFLYSLYNGEDNGVRIISDNAGGIIASFIILFIFLAIDFRFRRIIWRGARKEAYGRDSNNRYIIATIFLIIISMVSLAALIYSLIKGYDDRDRTFASLIVEITSFVIMCELLHSGFRIRRIREAMSKDNGEAS